MHSEDLITAKRWTPIATQRNRKSKNSASIQVKPTLTTCTRKITVINTVVNSKGKFPKAADNKFVQGIVKVKYPKKIKFLTALQTLICHLYTSETLVSKGTSQRTEKACPEPEDLEEDTLDTVVDGKTLREIIPTLPFTFQLNRNLKTEDWKDMGQAVQTPGGEGKQDKGESSHYPSHRRTTDPYRAYSDSFRLTRSRPNQLSSGFTPFRNQPISGQDSPFFTMPGSFQEKTRIQRQKQDHLQPKEGGVRPNDPESVGFGERSEQELELVVHSSTIASLINRNITPTQIEHNFVTPESNLKSDALWLQMSQYAEKTHK
ncbi:hypothetical protein O181_007030 [Austropuccinia psidii MF-1]|uniref:Uncharacterized protein n=1 Tax=Austropuccinia psidii MF-1 TaxID=1389203 RepID=A0A9Q3BLK3_9BASI|nr:hypothetical protein [Austropuccinia psidii MF-1]